MCQASAASPPRSPPRSAPPLTSPRSSSHVCCARVGSVCCTQRCQSVLPGDLPRTAAKEARGRAPLMRTPAYRLKRSFRFRVRIGFGVVFRSAPKSLFVPLLVFSRPQVVDVVDSKRLVNHADTRARSLFLDLVSLIILSLLAKQDFHPIRLQQMLPQGLRAAQPAVARRVRRAAHARPRAAAGAPRREARCAEPQSLACSS